MGSTCRPRTRSCTTLSIGHWLREATTITDAGILFRFGSGRHGLADVQTRLPADRAGHPDRVGVAGRRRARRRRSRVIDPWQDPRHRIGAAHCLTKCASCAGNATVAARVGRAELRHRPELSRNARRDRAASAFARHHARRRSDRAGRDRHSGVLRIRPNSRALSVCQGKGMCRRQRPPRRHHGGVEQALAERHEDLVSETGSQDEMEARGLRCISSHRCSGRHRRPDPRRERSWVAGLSMVDGRQVHVPFELVGLRSASRDGVGSRPYTMSTVGLGAGRILAEASLHALLEVVENDASGADRRVRSARRLHATGRVPRGHHDRLG